MIDGADRPAGGRWVPTTVGADMAEVAPPALRAMTSTRTVPPTSSAVSRKVGSVAPATLPQFSPLSLQRYHWCS